MAEAKQNPPQQENTMRYALLIYTNEAEDMKMTAEEQEANMAAYYAFTAEVRDASKYLGGEALHPTNTAKTVSEWKNQRRGWPLCRNQRAIWRLLPC
jgi:hypothetical protein